MIGKTIARAQPLVYDVVARLLKLTAYRKFDLATSS
jgi:hypothetical protein